MIGDPQKQQIRQVLQSPQWQAAEALANELCRRIREQAIVKDDWTQTLQEAYLQEGQIRGIRSFLQELYKAAHGAK